MPIPVAGCAIGTPVALTAIAFGLGLLLLPFGKETKGVAGLSSSAHLIRDTSLFTIHRHGRTAMKISMITIALILLVSCAGFSSSSEATSALQPRQLQPGTLCEAGERIIFSCPVKRPAKIVSLCASKDLTNERGYVQYRFGLPGKVELEYPKERAATQEKFHYTHYFRAQVDLTEISFTNDGYEYQITDDYNGEEKPAQWIQGIVVTAPGQPKEVSLSCRTKPKADYTDLQAVFASGER